MEKRAKLLRQAAIDRRVYSFDRYVDRERAKFRSYSFNKEQLDLAYKVFQIMNSLIRDGFWTEEERLPIINPDFLE